MSTDNDMIMISLSATSAAFKTKKENGGASTNQPFDISKSDSGYQKKNCKKE